MVRTAIRGAWARLRGGQLTPGKAAASVALGLIVGVTPLWGLHLWIVLGVGLALRLDVPLAYLAANISIPPLLPFITAAEIEIGALLRTGAFLGLTRAEIGARGVAAFLKDLWIGTAVLGPALATVFGGVTYAAVAHRRGGAAPAPAPPEDPIERVAARYAHGSIATRMYVAGKLRSDPVGSAVVALGHHAPLGAVLDLGCGRGQLALLLLEAGVATEVHGLDWDAAKVDEATRAAEGLRATFAPGDVRTFDAEPADTVLLIDVLHYFTESEQSEILARAAGAAQKRLVVRDIDPERGLRSALTRLQERLTTRAKYNTGERVRVRSMREVRRELEALGFTVTIEPCWGKTPFSNVLVVAARSTA